MQKLETYLETSKDQILDTTKEIEKFSNELYKSKELHENNFIQLDCELKSVLTDLKKKKGIRQKLEREVTEVNTEMQEKERMQNELKRKIKEINEKIAMNRIKMNRLNNEKIKNAEQLSKMQLSVNIFLT